MKKAALHNLGCKVNSYETEAMRELLEKAGYEIVDFHDMADVYVINTCTVTNIADRKSRQMISRARTQNPDAIIVAAGCYVQNASHKETDADILIGNDEKGKLPGAIEAFEGSRTKSSYIRDIIKDKSCESLEVASFDKKSRAFLKIEDGCDMYCTYCIIPYVRGRVRSIPPKEVADSVKSLFDSGCNEVVLNGILLSAYGKDLKTDLLELLRMIDEETPAGRIRLGSMEMGYLTEDIIRQMSQLKSLCPHFHLSLQSGSDGVLSRMGRKYNAADYAGVVEALRKYFHKPAITTDIICGFPGETEDEFKETLEFARNLGFSGGHKFPYSRREGTKADKFPNQLTQAVKKERVRILSALIDETQRAYEDSLLGESFTAVLEDEKIIDKKKYFTAHTERYLEVLVPADDIDSGSVGHDFGRNPGCVKGKLCRKGELLYLDSDS